MLDDEGFVPFGAVFLGEAFFLGVHVGIGVHEAHIGAEKVIQQQIALRFGGFELVNAGIASQDEGAFEPQLGASGSRLAAVVGLDGSAVDDDIATLLQCHAEAELQVSHLVAPKRQARQIVPLDEQANAQKFRKARQGF
jgi:hypothetical protein